MPDVCTCGAKLLPDSRFCHKCGKPQRDEPIIDQLQAEEAEALTPPVIILAPPVLPAPIGIKNGLAIRTALFAGFLTFSGVYVLGQIAQPLAFASVIAGGFLTVYLYEKRTGQRLSVGSGARLGWLCGVFIFGVMAALWALNPTSLSDPTALNGLRESLKSQGTPAETVEQVVHIMQTPGGISILLGVMFLMLTLLTTCGGALGAKLLGATSVKE